MLLLLVVPRCTGCGGADAYLATHVCARELDYSRKTQSDLTVHSRRRGVVVSGVRRMNEVNARRARLVPGWVTVFGRVHRLGMKQANYVNSALHPSGVA